MKLDPERKDFLGRGWAFPVQIDTATGAIASVEYELDVRQSIEIILGTSAGERVMRPTFGCGIHDLVFESVDVATMTRIESAVREALTRYEARIDVLNVNVNADNAANGELLIELEYRIRRTNQTGNLVYPFYFKESGTTGTEGSRG